jgi:cytoplasmic iron level regulating protein YaaA (DUF328/UPF0246 family)
MKIILSPSKTQNDKRKRKDKGRAILKNETIHAIECYNGGVFKQIDLDSYDKDQFSYMQEKLIILSPLYGPINSDTEIWPYRLEMNLKPDGINLYEYWQEVMKDYFADVDLIINLAANEYSKAVEKNYGGKLLNELIKNQAESLDQIKEINLDGYVFNDEQSDEQQFRFIKPYKK